MIERFAFEKIYNFLKKYNVWILIPVFVILLAFNGWVYYKYVYLSVSSSPGVNVTHVKIMDDKLNQILNELKTRQETLDRVKQNQYKSPFGRGF